MTIEFEADDPRTSAPRQQRVELCGYKVGARDGDAGTIHDVSWDAGFPCLVVKTRPWVLGKKVRLAARLITRIDSDELRVYVDRTKNQIKQAPQYQPLARKNDATGTR